jgi:hypothetical protein
MHFFSWEEMVPNTLPITFSSSSHDLLPSLWRNGLTNNFQAPAYAGARPKTTCGTEKRNPYFLPTNSAEDPES